MSRNGFVRRKLLSNFWDIAVGAVIGALLCLSFYMLVKSQILYGLADSVRVGHGTLNVTANVFGVAGLVLGIPSVVAFLVGNFLKKY